MPQSAAVATFPPARGQVPEVQPHTHKALEPGRERLQDSRKAA